MASSNSHQNALQGHMVNLFKGAKIQPRLHFQVLWVHTSFYRSKRGDGSIHRLSGRGFMSLSPQCKNCTVCHWPKPYLMRWQGNAILGPLHWRWRGVLAKIPCHRPNGLNGSSIGVPNCKLWRVLTRIKMPFKDTWWICLRHLKCKLRYIFKFCKHINVCISIKEVMDLSTGSWRGVS